MNTTVENEVVSPEVAVKKTRGAKPNPNSKYNRAKKIISNLPEAERVRKNVLEILGRELGLSLGVASVYFYNIQKELKPQPDPAS